MDAKILVDTLKAVELEPTRYSGRFMFGRYCVGVIVPDVVKATADIMMGGKQILDEEQFDELYRLVSKARWDNMGRDDMILYWPDADWPDELDEVEEE